jgi:hypothetical protein
MEVTFADGTTFEYVNAEKVDNVYYDGERRSTLEIQFKKDAVDYSTLEEITATDSDALSKIILTKDSTTNIYTNFYKRKELTIKPITITAATDTSEAVTEERYCLVLAQLVYDEVQRKKQSEAIEALGQQIIALTLGGNA